MPPLKRSLGRLRRNLVQGAAQRGQRFNTAMLIHWLPLAEIGPLVSEILRRGFWVFGLPRFAGIVRLEVQTGLQARKGQTPWPSRFKAMLGFRFFRKTCASCNKNTRNARPATL